MSESEVFQKKKHFLFSLVLFLKLESSAVSFKFLKFGRQLSPFMGVVTSLGTALRSGGSCQGKQTKGVESRAPPKKRFISGQGNKSDLREREIEREREKKKKKREKERGREREKKKEKRREGERETQTERQKERERKRERETERDRETERQRERQRERREMERDGEKERDRETEKESVCERV